MSTKKMKSIQVFEQEMLECVLLNKNTINDVQRHYFEKSYIKGPPNGRPNKRIVSFTQNNNTTFFDKICDFTWTK